MNARVILAALVVSGLGLLIARADTYFFCDPESLGTLCNDEPCTPTSQTLEIYCQDGYVPFNRVNVEGWGGHQCRDTPNPSTCPTEWRDCDKLLYYKSPPVYDPEDCEVEGNLMCTVPDPQDFCRVP